MYVTTLHVFIGYTFLLSTLLSVILFENCRKGSGAAVRVFRTNKITELILYLLARKNQCLCADIHTITCFSLESSSVAVCIFLALYSREALK